MATTLANFDSGHTDSVHDAQFDYYGKRIATCSSDQSIKIFDVIQNSQSQQFQSFQQSQNLYGHQGSVWQVQWAHPKFGNILASCGFDNKVIIWKEQVNKSWVQVYQYPYFGGSVNSINFAPHEYGLTLVCACTDGCIYLLEHQGQGTWGTQSIKYAHGMGVSSVSFAPYIQTGNNDHQVRTNSSKKFVSGGLDGLVKVWTQLDNGEWDQIALDGHSEAVNDVQWAPQFGTSPALVASASQDGKVIIWAGSVQGEWCHTILNDFGSPVYRLSFSSIGNILAVTSGKNQVSLWNQALDNTWQLLNDY